MYLADSALARKLERAEACCGAAFVEARARLFPESGAQWIDAQGAYAIYDGPRSPVTQTFGLGVFEPPTVEQFERLEAFFRDRGAPVLHETTPVADPKLLPMLTGRGYKPVEYSTMLYMPLTDPPAASRSLNPRLTVRPAAPADHPVWIRTAIEGWREHIDFADIMTELLTVSCTCEGTVPFLAEIDGDAIAAGALRIQNGVAVLAGATTVPAARRQGAQRMLLEQRLRYARQHGCELAMMVAAEPGGASQRNAERQGFRIAYTRIKWGLGD